MKKLAFLILIGLSFVFMVNCEDDGESIIGSKDHDITIKPPQEPAILADGISSIQIYVQVIDRKGEPAARKKVVFQTTAGTITKASVTDYAGYATAKLTSVASESDVEAMVKATVMDSVLGSMSRQSSNQFILEMRAEGFEKVPAHHLKKAVNGQATLGFTFLGVSLQADIADTILPADGLSKTEIRVSVFETTSRRPVSNGKISLHANKGKIASSSFTDKDGILEIALTAGKAPGPDTLFVNYGDLMTRKLILNYIETKLLLEPEDGTLIADGKSQLNITAVLTTHKNTPIQGATVNFSTSAGVIPASSETDQFGQATVGLIASSRTEVSTAQVVATFHDLSDTVTVHFEKNYPTHILLSTDNPFIWVRETGHLQQTDITATVIGASGEPIDVNAGVRFKIVNGPGGGENLIPSGSTSYQSEIIQTVSGVASAQLQSGTKSGTIQIRAELADNPSVAAQTTNIVIRSGPPYMWVDPADPNHVIQHGIVLIEPGKHNVAFANPVQDIGVTAIFVDKYNNPIEQGTTVYFTSTGGGITTDAETCELGKASALLMSTNPFPVMQSIDVNHQSACCMPNYNDPGLMMEFGVPDFEASIIRNSMGSLRENDGIAMVLASTRGKDQNGNDITVWAYNMVVFSQGVLRFTATTDKNVLLPGETANILIRLYDVNGNPVAAGSSLRAESDKGELLTTNLMPERERYGMGTTFFSTVLTNNLKPGEDEFGMATVKLTLKSPNGDGILTIPIDMRME
ncbi:hypothetical protein GF406_23750 [candidate division KSB1 bacterium]|nr:hypothetical protein [candidate division KSB1 bacterium]